MKKPIAVVGDIHGCLEEFEELLKMLSYNSSNIRLISAGDLMDRGPNPSGCVKRIRELGIECVKGNHEDKHLRWRKHETARKEKGKPNPMKSLSLEERLQNEALSEEDIKWMYHLPVKINLLDDVWLVHGGVEPRCDFNRQNNAQMMRVRYVDERGIGKALNPDKSQPEGTVYWSEMWKGPQSIVYGHCVHNLKNPRVDYQANHEPLIAYTVDKINLPDVKCLGIDTGCVFGGALTCAIFTENNVEFVQVPAKKKYCEGYDNE